MIILLLFLVGLFVGSFLGVLVDRIPKRKPFIYERSICDFCKEKLNWYDLIPVLSFILLRGKCRYCKKTLPLFYPTIELLTGIVYILIYLFITTIFPFSYLNLVYYFFICSLLIVIFYIDFKHGIIPDKILLSAVLATSIYLVVNNLSLIYIHFFSGVFASLFFLIISLLYFYFRKKIAMGGGDIKFAFLMGLILGFPGIIVGLYSAFLTAALYSIILIIWGKKAFLKDSIPFGPFLVLGTFISIFWGNLIFEKALIHLGLL